MAMPTSYTEEGLAAFMVQAIGHVAGGLGLTAGSFVEAVNDTINAYGVDDITEATDIPALRTLARMYAWRVAADNAADEVNVSGDGRSLGLGSLSEQISKRLEAAEEDAEAAGFWVRGSSPYITRTAAVAANDVYAAGRGDDEEPF